MTMGSISFQSNISLILLIIIGILAGIYFYLYIRKIKSQIDDLEKSNGEIIKEIGNIGMGLHGILKGNIQEKELQREEQEEQEEPEEESGEELVEGQQSIDKEIDGDINEINDELIQSSINNETTIDEDNEINADLLKNDLDDEVYDDDDNSINTDDENIDMDGLDENINDNIENFDEDQQDINNIDDLLDINITDDSTQQYLNMSVKELKEKCIELGLKHSGNKQTLAQRIHEKLS